MVVVRKVERRGRVRALPCVLGVLMVGAGGMSACATSLSVHPSELPALERELDRSPTNGDLLERYAVGLFDSGDCERALPVGRAVLEHAPASEIGPLVVGGCLEEAGDHGAALVVYRDYIDANPSAPGASAVLARAELAARVEATRLARAALAEETAAGQPEDPEATGVLPVVIVGDSSLSALSLGLAHMLTTDLAILERFRVLERLQLQALMDEMELSQSDRVDPATAARVGRVLQAGRLVQGTMVGQPDQDATLSASVLMASGDMVEASDQQGPMRDLLRLEKELVLALADDLGYQLTEAERRRILESGPRNLRALIAFSNGLLAESRGNWAEAAEHYGAALRADPSFSEARQRLQVAVGVTTSSGPANVPVGSIGDDVDQAVRDQMRLSGVDSQGGVRLAGIIDLTGHQSERSPPADPIDVIVDPPRGPEPSSFLIDLILTLRIPGR